MWNNRQFFFGREMIAIERAILVVPYKVLEK